MTQHQLIIEYINEHGSILPAKLYGSIYKDEMFGSETSKRCRELRKKGVLVGVKEGRFERFYLTGRQPLTDNVKDFLKQWPSKQEIKQPVGTLF